MRHIDRCYKPQILKEKDEEWTRKFLESGKNRPSSKQYAHKDIIDALMNLSNGKCFYSEKKLQGLPKEVDHLIEVSIDKSKAFEWENLYLSTKECNDGRPTEEDLPKSEVLDPCINTDEEIMQHLTFEDDVAVSCNNSEIGEKTIKKFKLNNESLLFQRMRFLQKLAKLIFSCYERRLKEGRMDFTDEEKQLFRSYARPDKEFSLMVEIYLRKNVPSLWT